jgi:outer membrane lipoprotein-sorting protein
VNEAAVRRLLVCAFLLTSWLPAASAAASLKEVLDRMDRAAASFQAVTAKVRKASLTAVINDETVEQGVLWMARSARKIVRMKIEFREPDPRVLAFAGRKGEVYYPKINTVQEYDLGRHGALVDQFLLLGFGTPGRELARDYQIRLAGAEQVAGLRADRLELVPKAKEARQHIAKVELWIADPGGYPVQQKFYTPSGDTTTITYTGVVINPPLSDSDLTLKVPPDARREYPQR